MSTENEFPQPKPPRKASWARRVTLIAGLVVLAVVATKKDLVID